MGRSMNVFPEPEAWSFEKSGHRGKVYPTGHLLPSIGFVLIEVDGDSSATVRQKRCDFTYHVLSGAGTFVLDGREVPCRTGDLVAVPAGTSVSFSGSMRMFLVSDPAWSDHQEEYLSD